MLRVGIVANGGAALGHARLLEFQTETRIIHQYVGCVEQAFA